MKYWVRVAQDIHRVLKYKIQDTLYIRNTAGPPRAFGGPGGPRDKILTSY